jgi:hypothetical protein
VPDPRLPVEARDEGYVNGSSDMGTGKPAGNNDPTLIPYTLHVEAVPADSGCGWVYRVEYIELDDCVVEDRDLLRALSRLDSAREMAEERGDDVIGSRSSHRRESEGLI